MSLFKEFKSFAMRGNVVDMAVGIIIGASFGKIISSLVNDILMPPIGALIGGMDFSNLAVTVMTASAEHPAVVIKYGMFINMVIDFLIVAFAMFMIIQAMNRLMKKPEAAACSLNNKRMSGMFNGHPCQCKDAVDIVLQLSSNKHIHHLRKNYYENHTIIIFTLYRDRCICPRITTTTHTTSPYATRRSVTLETYDDH